MFQSTARSLLPLCTFPATSWKGSHLTITVSGQATLIFYRDISHFIGFPASDIATPRHSPTFLTLCTQSYSANPSICTCNSPSSPLSTSHHSMKVIQSSPQLTGVPCWASTQFSDHHPTFPAQQCLALWITGSGCAAYSWFLTLWLHWCSPSVWTLSPAPSAWLVLPQPWVST